MKDQSTVSRSRRWFWLGVRILVAFGLLALAIWTNRGQLREVGRNPIHAPYFLLGFVMYLAGVFLAYLRWYLLVRAVGLSFRIRDAVRLGLIGTMFNFVIPGAIGGDFVKAAFLCREQSKRAKPIASIIVDRIVGLIGLFLIAGIAGTFGWDRLQPPVRKLVTIAWIATGVATLLLGIAFLPLDRLRSNRSRKRAELAVVGDAYRRHVGIVILGIMMGTITHFLNVVAFFLVSLSLFPVVPSFTDHLLIVPLVLFTTAVPLPFGALGVTEQVSLGLFRLASYSGGGVAMMGFRILQFGSALIGLIVYLADNREIRELQARAERIENEPVQAVDQ
jgi:uncharacterized membrane protein YbhN (UPF0104 family)